MQFHKLDQALDTLKECGIPGFSTSVRYRGEEVYCRHEGYSDRERTKPVNGEELYYIYSCSKPITCVATMQLWERGKFELEDKIADYLPEFTNMTVRDGDSCRPARGDIYIDQLFSMTAGLTYDLNSASIRKIQEETAGRVPTRDAIRYLAREPLAFDPGTDYLYSLGHDVLAALVEVCADMPFNDYVTEHIFRPLGMNSTTYLPSPQIRASLAEQYTYHAENGVYEPIGNSNIAHLGTEYASGGGGCVSTRGDYSLFYESLRRGNEILKNETVDLMVKNRLNATQLPYYSMTRYGYGYGLGVRCERDGSGCTDFGWGGMAGAYGGCDRVCDFTFVHMQHVISMPNQEILFHIPAYIREALGNI